MPQSRPITRAANKDPLELTLVYLKEHVKYLQRCLRNSEKKNIVLEQELESSLSEISSFKEQFALFTSNHSTTINILHGRIAFLSHHNKELEREIKKLKLKVGPKVSSWSQKGGP